MYSDSPRTNQPFMVVDLWSCRASWPRATQQLESGSSSDCKKGVFVAGVHACDGWAAVNNHTHVVIISSQLINHVAIQEHWESIRY